MAAELDFSLLCHNWQNVSRFPLVIQAQRKLMRLKLTRAANSVKTQWTLAETAVQFCSMWRSLIVVLLLGSPQVWAQENASAYEALRVVGSELGRGALNHIVSITGVKGDPQPEIWRIILEDPEGRGVREVRVAEGRIGSDDRPDRSTAGSTEGAVINISRLNLDSSGAFAVASHTAEASHAQFATADYALRTDERGEPIWIVTLMNRSSRPVGTIYIGATRGTVKRTDGMFAGATMEDVENDYDEGEGSGVISDVKRTLKHTFHRTQDEARDMFHRVKRSFSDFINRE
jgi:hypothetical protein